MKNVIATALFLGIAIGSATAQTLKESSVPQPVRTAFVGKYATAKDVKWDKEGGAYEASFKLDGQKKSAVYSAAGKQTELEMGISAGQLPETVRAYMKAHKLTITEAAEITDPSGKKYYEAEAGGKDYLFDALGKPVNKIGQ